MRVVSALSGDLLLSLPDGEDERDAQRAVAELLGIRSAFVLATVTECTVVVLSGKLLCCSCGAKAFCSCNAEAACDCKVLEHPEGRRYLCAECDARESAEAAGEDWLQRQKDCLWS